VAVDNAWMRQIADLSGGQFFTATSEGELRPVYAELGEQPQRPVVRHSGEPVVAAAQRWASWPPPGRSR
jgi:hypothetical protein